MTAVLTFVIAIQNPFLAAGIHLFGQASPSSQENLNVHPTLHTNDRQSIENDVQAVIVDKIDELKEEKRSLDNSSASILHQVAKKAKETNLAFIQLVNQTDVTRLDLRKPSGLNSERAEALIQGTGLEGLGKAFVETEEKYQINAYYLIAHAAWESGWGRSRISKEKNNLFGFTAYDSSPYSSARGFSSKQEGIDVVANYIHTHYLNPEGKYFNGSHLKGMNVRYATDENWQRGIAKIMISLANKTPLGI